MHARTVWSMRRKKTRSYTMTDIEHAALIESQLPYRIKDDEITTNSGLIIHALKRLPRKPCPEK